MPSLEMPGRMSIGTPVSQDRNLWQQRVVAPGHYLGLDQGPSGAGKLQGLESAASVY